jgi:hypothetical protein
MTLQITWHCRSHDNADHMTLQITWQCRSHDTLVMYFWYPPLHLDHHTELFLWDFIRKILYAILVFPPSCNPYFALNAPFVTSVAKQILDGNANYEASDCLISVCHVSVTWIKNILFGILSSNALTSWITVQQDVTVFIVWYICRQLYMFRALTPIIGSWYSCNYSFWHSSAGSTRVPTQQHRRMVVDPVEQYQKL